MKKLMLILGTVMLFSFMVNAQSIAGKYSNAQTTWEFIKTNVEQEYDYKGYNQHGELISIGEAFYSKSQKRVVLIFKRTDLNDSVGFASCKVENGKMEVKTFHPDGKVRWEGGTLTKK